MDVHLVVRKLEEAAKVLLAPPNLVSSDQRQQAEQVFLEFRKFSLPYETCRFILEHSKNEYAQFQAATTIKSSIVKEWATLPSHDVEQLRMFLLQYVTSHPSLQSYVREEIFQTLAVMVKRGMLESDAIAKDRIFNEITQLISTGDLSMQLIACSLLTALLNEFSCHTKSAGSGFTWEFHIKCKRHFEDDHLLQAVIFTLQMLSELVKYETPFDRTQLPVVMRFLSIAEQIFSWEFLPPRLTRRHMAPFGSLNQAPLRPPVSWRKVIMDQELLNLFFVLYSKVHYNSELSHHALQALCQLASVNGGVFESKDMQLQYLTCYVTNFVKTIKCLELQGYDAIGISTVFENLLRWFGVDLYAQLPVSVMDPFISWMTTLTCKYTMSAVAEDKPSSDDNVYNEALEKMLFSWTSLLVDADEHFARGQFKKQATEIFNAYVQCHVTDLTKAETKGADEEEYEEEDLPDKEKYADHLSSIGYMGREVVEHSLPTLARVIDERSERLKIYLEHLSQQVKSVAAVDNSQLNNIYEDLHWLLLIATSVLSDDAKGETPLMPTPILKHSMAQADLIDAQQTLNLITKPELCSGQASQTNRVDHVIRLLSSVLRLFYIESIAVANGLGHSLSPQLDATSMHFMERFASAYLIPREDNYNELSITLQSILGKGTEGSMHFINLLIDKIKLNLSVWNSEEQVVEESLQVLVTLAYSTCRCEQVVQCPNFWSFVLLVSENAFPFNSLPASAKRTLYRAVVFCSGCLGEKKEGYWDQMVRKPLAYLSLLINESDFKQKKNEPAVKESIIHSLETLIGCCQAARINTQADLFDAVDPALQSVVTLLDVYHCYQDIVELCLDVFCEVVSSMICCLDSSCSERLYEHCLAAIRMYATHNTGRKTVDADAEEDKFKDVLLILKLLINLMSKDLIDFGLNDDGKPMAVSATEVVLYGLTVTVPLMDASLLQFPSLCSQYYKLLAFTSELRPDKVLELPPHLLDLILSSVHLSFTRFGSDVAKSGFEFLTEILTHAASAKNRQVFAGAKLERFMQPILNLLLFEPFDVDLCDIISGCLYYLILIFPAEYKQLEMAILEQQKDQPHHQLLAQSFQKLASSPEAGGSRKDKITFVDSMNQVLLDVKGFLCVL